MKRIGEYVGKKQWEALHSACIVIVFLLCARFLQFDFLYEIPGVQSVYARLSQICSVCVILAALLSIKRIPKPLWVAYLSLCVFYGVSFLATLVNAGSIQRMIGAAYPVLALTAFVLLECTSVNDAKRFLRALANLFLFVTTVNVILMIFAPGLFGTTDTTHGNIFFLGLENQIGYPCTVGLLLVLLNDCLNHEKWKVQWYAIVFALTTVLNFSVGSLMGAAVLCVYLIIPQIKKLFGSWHMMAFVGLAGILFAVLVFFHEPVLNFPPIRFVLEDILHKDTTLTNRTLIWDEAMSAIAQRPFLGYGMAETSNVISIRPHTKIVTMSAHNQYIQTWFEGGTVALLAFVMFLLVSSILLEKSPDKRLSQYTKLVVTAQLVMFMTEAPGFGSLLFILSLGAALSVCLEQDQRARSQTLRSNRTRPEEKITVVVPVYNVQDYLPACLDSILNQTYQNLEIIVVNDGSTDASYEICKTYAQKDPRIILIDQENQGLSGARNTGIRIATGTYITFVDSDDVIRPDMIKYLHHLLKAHDADMSACQCRLVDEKGRPLAERNAYRDKVFSGTEECMKALFQDDELGVTAWGKLYKTSAFESVEYAVGKYHEDVYTTHLLVAQCRRIAAGAKRMYLYRQRGDSIVHAEFSPKHLDAVEGSEKRARFVAELCPKAKLDAQGMVVWACNSCVMRMKNNKEIDERAVEYLQKRYRQYEGAFLLGNFRLSAKLFSVAASVNLRCLLDVLRRISKVRR